jgi:hypothetical protein
MFVDEGMITTTINMPWNPKKRRCGIWTDLLFSAEADIWIQNLEEGEDKIFHYDPIHKRGRRKDKTFYYDPTHKRRRS